MSRYYKPINERVEILHGICDEKYRSILDEETLSPNSPQIAYLQQQYKNLQSISNQYIGTAFVAYLAASAYLGSQSSSSHISSFMIENDLDAFSRIHYSLSIDRSRLTHQGSMDTYSRYLRIYHTSNIERHNDVVSVLGGYIKNYFLELFPVNIYTIKINSILLANNHATMYSSFVDGKPAFHKCKSRDNINALNKLLKIHYEGTSMEHTHSLTLMRWDAMDIYSTSIIKNTNNG